MTGISSKPEAPADLFFHTSVLKFRAANSSLVPGRVLAFVSGYPPAHHACDTRCRAQTRGQNGLNGWREGNQNLPDSAGRSGGSQATPGDHRTPEGIYTIDSRNDHSTFYKARWFGMSTMLSTDLTAASKNFRKSNSRFRSLLIVSSMQSNKYSV